jgi:histone acetyltransferase 1
MSDGAEATYVIHKGYLTKDQALRAYHAKVQLFALWTIETANFISSDDPCWELYLVYVFGLLHSHHSWERKTVNGVPAYAFVGFCTVYDFYAFPTGTRKRISQFFIVPPFQRKGHGRKFML